jgi:hypothetical protein
VQYIGEDFSSQVMLPPAVRHGVPETRQPSPLPPGLEACTDGSWDGGSHAWKWLDATVSSIDKCCVHTLSQRTESRVC